jgi:hypothetical protein
MECIFQRIEIMAYYIGKRLDRCANYKYQLKAGKDGLAYGRRI